MKFLQSYLLVILMAVFFFSEIVVIYLLGMLQFIDFDQRILPTFSILDASIMTIISAPLVWWFIAKQKQSEEKIRKEKEFTANLLKCLKDGFAAIDHEGKLILVNDELCKMTGYSEKELLSQKPPFNFWAEEGLKDIKEAFEKTLKGVEKEYELVFKKKDDERFIALVSPRITTDPNENVISLVTIKDITQHKRLEENLNKERQDLKLIIDSSPIIIFYKDIDGKLIRINRTFADSLKMPEEDIVGKTVFDLYSTRIAQDMTNDDQEVFTSGRPKLNIVEQYESASGIRWVQTDKIPICDKNGIPVGLIGFALDITERKRVEDELKDVEFRYRTLFERSPDGVLIIDPETSLPLLFNDKACNQLGYSREEFSLMRISDYEIETPEKTKARIEKILREGRDDFETKQHTKTGELRDVLVTVQTINLSGRTVFNVIFRDITERKRGEEQLRLFRLLMDHSNDALIVVDPVIGRLLDVNETACCLLQYTRDELLHCRVLDIQTTIRDAATWQAHVQLLQSQGQRLMEFEGKRRDGITFPVEVSLDYAMLEDQHFIIANVRDITERKQAENALKESEEKHRTLIENIQDGVFMIQDAKVKFANEAFARIGGYRMEEVIGMDFQELVAPEDLEMVANNYQRRQAGENVPEEYEFRVLRKDGTRATVNMNVGLIKYHDRVASMGTVKDITERKRVEDELKYSEERYRMLVEHNPDAIIVHIDEKVVFSNKAGARLLGVENPEQLNGILIKDFIHPDYWKIVRKRIRSMRDEGKEVPCIEQKYIRMDGKVIDVEVTAIPLTYMGKLSIQNVIRDITEHKRADEEINRMASIIKNIPEAVCTIDLSANILSWNESAENMLGYKAEDIIGKPISITIPEELAHKELYHCIGNLNTAGYFKEYETVRLTKDGRIIPVEIIGVALKDKDQNITGYASITKDISKRKRSENALKESEERYRRLVEYSPIGIMIHNLQELVFVNIEAARILGASNPEELIGKPIREIIHPDYWEMAQARIRMEEEGKTAPLNEEKFIRLDGTPVDVEVIAIPINYKGKLEVHSIVRDITERKITEKVLYENEQRLTSIYNTVGDVIMYLAVEPAGQFRFISVNPAFTKITGLSQEMVVGRTVNEIIHEPSLMIVLEKYQQAIEENAIVRWEETSDYPTMWMTGEVSIAPVVNAKGTCTHLVGSVHDITERKVAEDQIRRSLEEKDVLLREIYHRVKNNMQIISSMLKLQSRHMEDEKYIDIFKETQNRVMSMSLVHEKLYKSKDLVKIDSRNYIKDLVKGLLQSYNINGVSVAANINNENIQFGIDLAIPCGLIINELVTNSLKHAFPDGREGEIRISLCLTDENMIELSVSDNGVGIPEDVDFRTTKTLGLHLVTILAQDQLSGEINLNRNNGTEFKIKFKDMI